MRTTGRRSPIERATSEDLVSLATDVGPAPMQVGAVLRLAAPPAMGVEELIGLVADRIASVPRLRQRLVRTPFGCGRPIWVDDAGFEIHEHVRSITCPGPADEASLLAIAGDVVGTRLPRDRPLWRLTLISGLADGDAALVVAFHHVLADGIGGLAVLANLVDGMPVEPVDGFPRPAPSHRELFVDALRDRLRSIQRIPTGLGRVAAVVRQVRTSPPTRVAPTPWNRPTGPERRFVVVRHDLESIHHAARASGATVNDVVLTGVAAALGDALRARGDELDQVVVSVPVSARRSTTADDLGNRVGVVPVALPTTGEPEARLDQVAAATRAAKASIGASPTDLLGPAFRLLARVGAFGWFIDRQRLVHTFVTNLRGPAEQLSFLGVPITEVDVISLLSGNIGVAFAVMSYAGTLTVTVIADPGACPDLRVISDALEAELGRSVVSVPPPSTDPEEHPCVPSSSTSPCTGTPIASPRP